MNSKPSWDNPDSPMPYSTESEQAVLSCALQDSQAILPDLQDVSRDYFYDERHKLIWDCIKSLEADGAGIDTLTTVSRLKERGAFERIGGYPFITSIEAGGPVPSHIDYYLPKLREMFHRRTLIMACQQLSKEARQGTDYNALCLMAEQALAFKSVSSSEVHDAAMATQSLLDDLERRFELKGRLSGIGTGLIDLDALTDGIQPGEQFIIAARPSMGKTSLGMNIVCHCIYELKQPAIVVSMEMRTTALMRRVLSDRLRMSMTSIRKGSYSEGDFEKFKAFALQSKHAPIHFIQGLSGLGIVELCAQVKRLQKQTGAKLVMVDYLQKIRPSERHEKRTYEVGDVSGRLKALAVETGVAMLTLAQLNRDTSKENRPPRLSDLADSSQIERDADTVGLIYRNPENKYDVSLVIAKQRDGETDTVRLTFEPQFCRFQSQTMPYPD